MSDTFSHPRDPTHGRRLQFGELARNEGKMLNDRSFALLDGAMNLLKKAMVRLREAETEQAERLIDRAASMPYDPHDEGSPGIRGASQVVYNLVSDELEMSAEDDMSWLNGAVDVHARVDGAGRVELESVLHGFVLQSELFTLSRAEQRRIRQGFGHAPLEADLGDGPDLSAAERAVVIRSLVETAVALWSEYDELD